MRGSEPRISSAALFDVTIAGKEMKNARGLLALCVPGERGEIGTERNPPHPSLHIKLKFPPVQPAFSRRLSCTHAALQVLVVNNLRGQHVPTRGHRVCHRGSSSVSRLSGSELTEGEEKSGLE